MRNLIINLFSVFNKLWLQKSRNKSSYFSGLFYKVNVDAGKENFVRIETSETIRSTLKVVGDLNIINIKDAYIAASNISIKGSRNVITIGPNVRLRSSTIIVRGNDCKVEIGCGTTFGGIRIVNVGRNNTIEIGEDCLFSDNIELWASDTHSIYDESGNWINQEKPVKIGNKVWIGSRVVILKGVMIGDGSIIGMGSVVTKNIDSGVIAAGFPARIIKENVNWKLDYPFN